jgi:hypothetical protein
MAGIFLRGRNRPDLGYPVVRAREVIDYGDGEAAP